MTETKLQLIGVVTLLWNTIEIEMRRYAWTCGQMDEGRGQLITIDLRNVDLKNLAANLLQASDYAQRSKDEGLIVLEIFDQMRRRRNALVHGTPMYGEHGMLVGRLARFSARSTKGVVTVQSMDVSEEYLDHLVRDMVLCSEFIGDAQRKLVNELQYRNDRDLRRRSSLERWVFGYRAPPIDMALLDKHLAKLRAAPHEPAEPTSDKKRSTIA